MSVVINVLLITAATTYLIPGTSHVLDVDESSYNENTTMNCSSEAVYMNQKCKHCLLNNNNNDNNNNNNDPFHLQELF